MKISKDIVWRKIEGNIFIINPQRNMLYELNETASFIFESLSKGRKVEEICRKISSEYDVSLNDCEKDCKEIIDEMIREGLIYEK